MERNCDHCGQSYRRSPSVIGQYCSKACAYSARRKERTTHRRIRYEPEHPLAGARGLVSEARAVLFDRVGWGPHSCHWCGMEVDWCVGQRGNARGVLVADHLNSDPLDDQSENLVVSCGRCNGERARVVTNDEEYVVRANGTRLRVGEERACATCGKQFKTTASYRRYCSRGCFPSRSA